MEFEFYITFFLICFYLLKTVKNILFFSLWWGLAPGRAHCPAVDEGVAPGLEESLRGSNPGQPDSKAKDTGQGSGGNVS